MNNSQNASGKPACYVVSQIITVYLYPFLNVTGIIFNLFNAFTFYSIIKNNKNVKGYLYKYLLAKSLNDCYLFVVNIFSVGYFCFNCPNSYTYWIQVWYITCFAYFSLATELYSTFLDIFACLDRLLLMTSLFDKLKFYQSKYFSYIVIFFLMIFSLVFYVHRFFDFEIYAINNSSQYKIRNTEFFTIDFSKTMRWLHIIIRDVMGLTLIIAFNTMIMINFQKLMKKKEKLTSKKLSRQERKDREVTLMVLCNGVVFVFGHTPIFICYLPLFNFTNFSCAFDISRFILIFSYWIGFFFYYSFNLQFRRRFKELFGIRIIKSKTTDINTEASVTKTKTAT
ncbi:hypothetical protein BpHYR1_033079 [Brachionus plicatilis]|uniref:G-protein coupled receptors family 1 profile domain-containing protein n=1 Tax=Brachionus plicatilis TaxID=10195 RepID=A0A3M7RIR6_BRAPC|nr:hypothetical protein BpHYR1_033079 [Brachionus plicatilis]